MTTVGNDALNLALLAAMERAFAAVGAEGRGHAFGATGAILVATLLTEMERSDCELGL